MPTTTRIVVEKTNTVYDPPIDSIPSIIIMALMATVMFITSFCLWRVKHKHKMDDELLRSAHTLGGISSPMFTTPMSLDRLPDGPTENLPRGWQAFFDSNTGEYYFHHAATDSTQWEKPTS